jgi:hypothetical protein
LAGVCIHLDGSRCEIGNIGREVAQFADVFHTLDFEAVDAEEADRG